MKTTKQPTVDELNAIQAKWMALESTAPEKEKKEVFALLDLYPVRHLSVSQDLKTAQVMIDGMPYFAHEKTVQEAVKFLRESTTGWNIAKTRFDVAWCGKTGQWVAINTL